jgi:stringent starvation protein B
MNAADAISTRPYLIRALYEWCMDNGFTPYLAVVADDTVQVPREFVKDGEIVLNVSPDATSGLLLGNELIEFKARFGGVAREILVPVSRVIAIYARENGQGMAFPVPPASSAKTDTVDAPERAPARVPSLSAVEGGQAAEETDVPPTPPSGARPTLTRIK